MIFSDDRDKLKSMLNKIISMLDELDYDNQDCYTLDNLQNINSSYFDNFDDYLMSMYTLYIFNGLEYRKENLRQAV